MHRRRTIGVLALAALGLGLYGCAETSSEEAEPEPSATIREVKGTGLNEVTLTEDAGPRIGLRMTPVGEQAGVKSVPYAAVVYDSEGKPWVYISPKKRTYVRTRIAIADIVGDDVTITSGPDAGTPVVTRGAAELYGAEAEIGAEEPE
jgi:multidrug efflux pump subunit AcrA (membrane-fusion protein)